MTKEERILMKRVTDVETLRNMMRNDLEHHLRVLREAELSDKDRIDLVGRLALLVIPKISAQKEQETGSKQGDPLASV